MENDLVVFLVDDDSADREFFISAIDELQLPLSVDTYKNGVELFRHLDGPKLPHLVFIDINMPAINGIHCLRQIKNDQRLKEIPVIMYSGSTYDRDIDECYRDGAHYYMVKPHTFRSLLESLKIVFAVDWTVPPPIPSRDEFVIEKVMIRT